MAAAERGHSAMVEMLLGRKARVDAANAQGQTALARAASTGKKDVVQVGQRRSVILPRARA